MTDVYETPHADLVTRQADDFVYVGFWKRVAASLIDSVWMLLLIGPVLYWIYGPSYLTSDVFLMGFADFFFNYVAPALIVIGFWIFKGATPGKMVFSARIVDERTFEPAGTGQLIGRYFGYYVSTFALLLGFLWVGWDPRKQGFHDKLAKTVVVTWE